MIVTCYRAPGYAATVVLFKTVVCSYRAAMRKATVFDVARLSGVSIKTVSRVVNGEACVRASTRERVSSAIAELDYMPDQAARNLASYRQKKGAPG